MTDKLVKKYFENPDGRKEWAVTGQYGSLSFWVSQTRVDGELYGGVENHYNYRPSYMREDRPSHDNCFTNGGKCWHDGSSLWASEHWIPLILPFGNERIWNELSNHYLSRMKPDEEVVS